MAHLDIFKYSGGRYNVYVERYGYRHSHTNVTSASMQRLARLSKGHKRHESRCGNSLHTKVQLDI